MLVFRDHWQGEFCVALFGAIGWAAFGLVESSFSANQYRVLRQIMPEEAWMSLLAFFGLLQLVGMRMGNRLVRTVGAVAILTLFVCIFISVMLAAPWSKGLSVYFACIAIEAFAVIFHTAVLMRYGGDAVWTTKR